MWRMEQNFPVVPIFQNVMTTSRSRYTQHLETFCSEMGWLIVWLVGCIGWLAGWLHYQADIDIAVNSLSHGLE